MKSLFDKLKLATIQKFPDKAAHGHLEAPNEKGVYVIYGPHRRVLHVGSTPRAKRGIAQRLRNHMAGKSSFVRLHLKGNTDWLRGACKYQYLAVSNPRHRALLEAYAIGCLCPAHIGHGLPEKETS